MNIFLYWNYKDNDSKRIYSFLNDSEFVNKIQQDENLKFYKKCYSFEVDEDIKKEIADSELVLFFTHGDNDSILKFRYNDEIVKKRFVFIDKSNASMLKHKKVISICCNSARELGKLCVSDEVQSKFYIGFLDDITYDEGFTGTFKSIVYQTYSNAFHKALYGAYNGKWNAEKFCNILRKNIIDMLTKEILESDDRALGSITQPIFHRKTAKSLVVLGDSSILIFK